MIASDVVGQSVILCIIGFLQGNPGAFCFQDISQATLICLFFVFLSPFSSLSPLFLFKQLYTTLPWSVYIPCIINCRFKKKLKGQHFNFVTIPSFLTRSLSFLDSRLDSLVLVWSPINLIAQPLGMRKKFCEERNSQMEYL